MNIVKRIIAGVVLVASALSLTGCQKKEWTYEDAEKKFGEVIELDYDSFFSCAKAITNKRYYVSGTVTDVNSFNLSSLTIKDSDEAKAETIVGQDDDTAYFAEIGEKIYVCAEGSAWWYSFDTPHYSYRLFTIGVKDGYVSKDKGEAEYMSVYDFTSLMNKIYDKTYFKVKGVIFQDGESSDGTPKYSLYESDERKSYGVKLSFSEEQSNIVGKPVTVIGKLDASNSLLGYGLRECSLI